MELTIVPQQPVSEYSYILALGLSSGTQYRHKGHGISNENLLHR
jgi:hypothetical protein